MYIYMYKLCLFVDNTDMIFRSPGEHAYNRDLGTGAVNTLRPRQSCRHFADDIFKCIFLSENVWISLKISLKLVPKVQINNIPTLVQIMAWRRPGDKPLSEPMIFSSVTHICVTRPLWNIRVVFFVDNTDMIFRALASTHFPVGDVAVFFKSISLKRTIQDSSLGTRYDFFLGSMLPTRLIRNQYWCR